MKLVENNIIYQFAGEHQRVDRGERVRLYPGARVGNQVAINLLEVLDDKGEVKYGFGPVAEVGWI